MRRREFIVGLSSTAAWPVMARAQQSQRLRRVGVLMNFAATEAQFRSYLAAFVQGLRQLGWIEGENFQIDVRWNGGDATVSRTNAAQLIGLMPDVILAGSTVNLMAIRQVTSVVPVVFVQIADPVAQGFVASVSRPEGNLTGFSLYEFSFGSKWLALLKEIAPGVKRVGIMFNPETTPYWKFFEPVVEAAAVSLNIQIVTLPVRATPDIEPAMANFALQSNGGLMLLGDSFSVLRYALITDLAKRHRLPSIGTGYNFARDGGLVEYGNTTDLADQYRQAATYVDRILRGAKPSDLPVQAPDRYTFVINVKTAKELGLTVPESVLASADEVIE